MESCDDNYNDNNDIKVIEGQYKANIQSETESDNYRKRKSSKTKIDGSKNVQTV